MSLARVAARAALALAAMVTTSRARAEHGPLEPAPPTRSVPPEAAPPEPPHVQRMPRMPRHRALDPALVTGIAQEERDRLEGLRTVLRILLAPPRETLNLLYVAARTATNVMEQEQIVPRLNALMNRQEGQITIFPTLFFDPNRRPSIGLRSIVGARALTADLRGGTGGIDEYVAEARLRLAGLLLGRPVLLNLEALFDMRTDLQFLGIGQVPTSDARNVYRPDTSVREARYRERRARVILGFGLRPSEDTELLVSTSVIRRLVDDAPAAQELQMSRVFADGSIPGGPHGAAPGETRLSYSELAFRLDTRKERAAPSAGAFAEVYGGAGLGLPGDPTQLARFGFRAAAFLSVYRATNIISPKLVVERVQPFSEDARIPFTELVRQPEYRGFNNRRDHLAITSSLDYRWAFAPQISARIFVDATTVGRELSAVGPPRFAGGFGLDVHASASDIAQGALAFSEEGVGFFLSFGVPSSFTDRQHRD